MAVRLMGGKTAPRLLEDLKLYNPHRLPNSQYNVLTQLPAPFEGNAPPRRAAKKACKHSWALKPHQSAAKDISEGSDGQGSFVAATCVYCRLHLKLQITYSLPAAHRRSCPSDAAPLHHFKHVPTEFSGFARRFEDGGPEWWQALEHFRCTVANCGTELAVYTRCPRLIDEWVALLTDRDLITKRADAAIAADPSRFEGVSAPSPVQVLGNLRTYLQNAASGDQRHIMASNKRWMVTLGDSCGDLLHYLGFQKAEGEWIPPKIPAASTSALEDEMSIRVDDAIIELTSLLGEQSADERRMNRVDTTLTAAANDFRSLLNCSDYATKPGVQRINVSEEDEHPYYAGLGTVRDFHDTLLIYAYDQQQLNDPDNSPYYLKCIQGIAKGRESESLSTKAAIEESSGRVSLDDIKSAYEAFNFDFPNPSLTEDIIIGTFQSRITDAPRQEAELRRCLKIIGQHLNNMRIEQYASDTISSYEQALEWLGATADMNDEFIATLFSVKINDNAANESLARQALNVISKHRDSDALRSYLETGELKESDMDPAHAYSRLGVSDRTAEDELVISAFEVAVADAPSQKEDLLRALRAVAKDRNSSILLAMSGGRDEMKSADHKLAEWPVGLDNIGNTCYLNSLLQYFFTIKPLRDLVLNSKDFVMQIDNSAVQKKKVGSRQVTRREIERAQKFIVELGTLFQDMISAPVPQITPKLELARLTMLNSSAEEDLRRNSILSIDRPDLGSITEGLVASPIEGVDTALVESPPADPATAQALASNTTVDRGDASSEDTLVDQAMDIDSIEKPVRIFEDKENVSPTQQAFDRPRTPDRELIPLAESSPSRINEQDQGNRINLVNGEKSGPASSSEISFAPPTRPPPVPPRQNVEKKTTIRAEEELYRQQDVTEVIGNVLFQLQCAIKPDEIDASGEQIDLIKELFYGKMKTTTTNAEGKARVMEEFFSDLKISVHSGPQNLYTAIDAAFEKRMVEVGGSEEAQFNSISKLPAVLQFYPNRTGFDRERGTPYKVNNHLQFYETIYMDRYMDTADPQIQRRRAESWAIKEQLKRVEEKRAALGRREQSLDRYDALQLTARFVDQVRGAEDTDGEMVPSTEPTLAEKLRQAAADAQADQARLLQEEGELREQLEAVWADESLHTLPYRLHAVFIHRGLVTSGHYWIYIFDEPRQLWRKYNDGYVTPVADPDTEIFGQEPGDRPATAMFLVYVRQDREDALVDALHRDVAPEAAERSDGLASSAQKDPAAMDGVEPAVPYSLLDAPVADKKWERWASEPAQPTQPAQPAHPLQPAPPQLQFAPPPPSSQPSSQPQSRSQTQPLSHVQSAPQVQSPPQIQSPPPQPGKIPPPVPPARRSKSPLRALRDRAKDKGRSW